MATCETAPLAWHDGMLVGHPALDAVHEEFVALIAALSNAADADVAAALQMLATHSREHFATEDDWMIRSGFPARACHLAEHEAVMRSVAGVQTRVAAGDVAAARRLAMALAEWFPGHADYLDAALVHWMCKQQHGGKPVVIRRHRSTDPSTDLSTASSTDLPVHPPAAPALAGC